MARRSVGKRVKGVYSLAPLMSQFGHTTIAGGAILCAITLRLTEQRSRRNELGGDCAALRCCDTGARTREPLSRTGRSPLLRHHFVMADNMSYECDDSAGYGTLDEGKRCYRRLRCSPCHPGMIDPYICTTAA